jgi:hypothetical protein
MSEATAIVALVLLALVVVSALILLWRRPDDAIPAAALRSDTIRSSGTDDSGDAALSVSPAANQWADCPRETIEHIFGPDDLNFIRCQGSHRLRRAFERDRRQIALHWVWSAFDETHRVMSHHFQAVRSSPDLSISLESKLVAEFLLHQFMCLTLAGALRVAGPNSLARLAGAIGNLRHQVGKVIEGVSKSAPGDLTKDSGLRTHS